MKVRCLVCTTLISFDPSIKEDTVRVMQEKNVSWEVMKAALDRQMCKNCRKVAAEEGA